MVCAGENDWIGFSRALLLNRATLGRLLLMSCAQPGKPPRNSEKLAYWRKAAPQRAICGARNCSYDWPRSLSSDGGIGMADGQLRRRAVIGRLVVLSLGVL